MARNDSQSPEWIVNASLATTGNLTTPNAPLFAHQSLLGFNAFSITLSTPPGSTAVGSIKVQCTDAVGRDLNNPNVPWVDMNYPNSTTPIPAIAIASGANSANLQIYGVGCKYIRLRYTSTSGTGTLNAGITCRANSR